MAVATERSARADLRAVLRYYSNVPPPSEGQRLVGLVLENYAEVMRGIQAVLAKRPEHPRIPGVRRVRLGRFPYFILYTVHGDDAAVVAVVHVRSDYPERVARRLGR